MYSLADLPPELLAIVFLFLDRNTLRNLRQTGRSVSRSATNELFKAVHLFPDDAGLESFGNILAQDLLLRNILTIYIHTSNYVSNVFLCVAELNYRFINLGDQEHPDPQQAVPDRFRAHIARLRDLPFLRKVVLRLDEFPGFGLQRIPFVESVIKLVFAALVSFSVLPQSLNIRNMPMINPADSVVRTNITKVLKNLHALHLKVVSDFDQDAPDNNFWMPEPHTFFSELPSTWLAPTTSTLRHLTLYSDVYFGFFPKLDLKDIYFPHLKTLSLNKYTFFHDKQLDWILSHASTLTEIYLDDCPLIYEIAVSSQNKDRCNLENHEWFRRDNDPSSVWGYRYARRWNDYFDSFRENLPYLRHFRMGYDIQLRDRPPFEYETEIPLWLVDERMQGFHDGVSFGSPYVVLECMDMHFEETEGFVEYDEWDSNWGLEDEKSYVALLGKIGQKEKLGM